MLAAAEIQVSNSVFDAIIIGSVVYAAIGLWALIDTARRGRPGWTAAVVLLGPIGITGWIVHRARDLRAERASGSRKPVGL